jgi:general secretion pathway protein B
MSYILDALKKSEQQRLTAGVPSLTSEPPVLMESGGPAPHWKLLAAALLALNAGALGWWLLRPPAPPLPPGQPSVPISAPEKTPAAQAALDPARPAQRSEERPATPSSASGIASVNTHIQSPAPPPRDKPAAIAGLAAAPAPRSAEAAPPPPVRLGVVALADLPPSVRSALPPLKIGGYAEGPNGMMVVVDDRLLSEGDEFGAGLRVVKISPEGAIFSFRNYRFRP